MPSPQHMYHLPELTNKELYSMVQEFQPLGFYDHTGCEYENWRLCVILLILWKCNQSKIDLLITKSIMDIFLTLP